MSGWWSDWICDILLLSVAINTGAGVRPCSLDQPPSLGRFPRPEKDGGRGRSFNPRVLPDIAKQSHCGPTHFTGMQLHLTAMQYNAIAIQCSTWKYQVVRIACDLFNGSSDSCGYLIIILRGFVLQQQDQVMHLTIKNYCNLSNPTLMVLGALQLVAPSQSSWLARRTGTRAGRLELRQRKSFC